MYYSLYINFLIENSYWLFIHKQLMLLTYSFLSIFSVYSIKVHLRKCQNIIKAPFTI